MYLGLKKGPLYPIIWYQARSPVPLPEFQMTLRLRLLMSSGSKKKEPRYTSLSEDRASHLQCGLSCHPLLHTDIRDCWFSPINWRCLLSVLCPVRRPVTTLDCVLLKDKSLVFVAGLETGTDSLSYLSIIKTSPPCQMLAIHPALFFFLYPA